jgi:AcrR family transcriptional regulator
MIDEQSQFRTLSREDRRKRIIWAAKHVFLEIGLDDASMDDVAARAGTTKPTVYAHFKSKDELFAAVVDLIKGLFLSKLGSPAIYADEPIEAIALFCGRFVELVCWRDAVGYQRVALSAASRSPAMTKAVYDTIIGETCKSLSTYLRTQKLTRHSDRHAELILAATTGGPVIRHLYGVDEPNDNPPEAEKVAAWVGLKRIREVVKLIATAWES